MPEVRSSASDFTNRDRDTVYALTARLRDYRRTVEEAPEGIIQTTPEGRFISSNQAFGEILGFKNSDEMMQKITDIGRQIYCHPEVRESFLLEIELKGRARCEYEAWKADGSTTWLLASSRYIYDASRGARYYESIVEDVSGRRRREKQLEQLTECLLKSNSQLSRFAHDVAHDLAEPLRTIRSFTELLHRNLETKPNADAAEYLHFIADAATRMKNLIDDALAESRMEPSNLNLSRVDFMQLLKDVLQDLQSAVDESEATFDIGPMPFLEADRTKMFRVFQNLIHNALKFRGEKPPHISVKAESRDGTWIFSVSDNGIGFGREHSLEIFELFTRLHSQKVYPGTGIGLSLCKRIVESHGGTIWGEAHPGIGATFSFTLPARLTLESK